MKGAKQCIPNHSAQLCSPLSASGARAPANPKPVGKGPGGPPVLGLRSLHLPTSGALPMLPAVAPRPGPSPTRTNSHQGGTEHPQTTEGRQAPCRGTGGQTSASPQGRRLQRDPNPPLGLPLHGKPRLTQTLLLTSLSTASGLRGSAHLAPPETRLTPPTRGALPPLSIHHASRAVTDNELCVSSTHETQRWGAGQASA